MLALLQNEYIKVFARKSFKIACIFLIILAILPIIINSIELDEDVHVIIHGLIQTLLLPSGFYILFSTSNLVLVDELKTGTINLIATCPIQRWRILLSKYITILSITVVYTLLIAILLSFSNSLDASLWNFALIITLFYLPLNFLLSVLLKSSRTFSYIIGYHFLTAYFIGTGIYKQYIFLNYSFGIAVFKLIPQLVEYLPQRASDNIIPDIIVTDYGFNMNLMIYIIYLVILTLIPFIFFQKRDLAK